MAVGIVGLQYMKSSSSSSSISIGTTSLLLPGICKTPFGCCLWPSLYAALACSKMGCEFVFPNITLCRTINYFTIKLIFHVTVKTHSSSDGFYRPLTEAALWCHGEYVWISYHLNVLSNNTLKRYEIDTMYITELLCKIKPNNTYTNNSCYKQSSSNTDIW